MSTADIDGIRDVRELTRTYSQWSSTRGLRTDILPWRLWEKAKRLSWDPAQIDFSRDAEDWHKLDEEQRITVAGLARGFMVGEEGVTLDILPLILATADEGRCEETMFLTTFAMEEATHVDFFHRWFRAVDVDPLEMEHLGRKRMVERGVEPPEWERPKGLFEFGLPRVMRRLLVDRSPEAFLDAGVTYNQFVEGCLAIAGYRMWSEMFASFGVFPGLQEGLRYVQRDERRHIAYGTYLCRRIIAAHPETFEFGRDRMYHLRDGYIASIPGGAGEPENGDAPPNPFAPFLETVVKQVDRRVQVLERAKGLTVEEAESGTGAEEAEVELEAV